MSVKEFIAVAAAGALVAGVAIYDNEQGMQSSLVSCDGFGGHTLTSNVHHFSLSSLAQGRISDKPATYVESISPLSSKFLVAYMPDGERKFLGYYSENKAAINAACATTKQGESPVVAAP